MKHLKDFSKSAFTEIHIKATNVKEDSNHCSSGNPLAVVVLCKCVCGFELYEFSHLLKNEVIIETGVIIENWVCGIFVVVNEGRGILSMYI